MQGRISIRYNGIVFNELTVSGAHSRVLSRDEL